MAKCIICGKTIKSGTIGPECEARKKEVSDKYVYARESIISNQGEDIVKSARHNVNEFKSLMELENDGNAEKYIKRDKLLKIYPLKTPELTKDNCIKVFVANKLLKAFPPKPYILGNDAVSANGDFYALIATSEEDNLEKKRIVMIDPKEEVCNKKLERMIDSKTTKYHVEKMSQSEFNKNCREDYFKKYEDYKNIIENNLNDDSKTHLQMMKELELKAKDDFNKSSLDMYSKINMADGNFYKYKNNISPRVILYEMGDIAFNLGSDDQMLIRSQYEISEADSLRIKENVFESVKSYLENKKTNKEPTETKEVKRFKMADLYVNQEIRIAPEIEQKTTDEQLDYLNNKCRFRGIQWGNSVNDGERISHLKKFTESVHDLKNSLGLSDNEISFNGKLAIAFGARGTGDALAHYEPDLNIINLTRKNGPGALAHEWFHGLERNWQSKNNLPLKDGIFNHQTKGFIKGQNSEAHDSLVEIEKKLTVISERWRKTDLYKNLPRAKKDYFMSKNEIFARVGEVFVKAKLHGKNMENTYLSGSSNDDLWPTIEEVREMESHLDTVVKYMAKVS